MSFRISLGGLTVLALSGCSAASFSAGSSSSSSSVSPSSTTSTTSAGGQLISDLQPVLAVRGAACLMCHASVQSNIITDFGAGDVFYLGADTNYNLSAYGNGRSGWSEPGSIVGNIYVPSASASVGGASTLAGLVSSLVGRALTGQIVTASKVYIGAPTAAQIVSASSAALSATNYAYAASSGSTISFSGLTRAGGVWANSGALNCDGDLTVEGPLSLHGLTINTVNGCRIYATGTVFLDGAVTFTGTSSKRNLQLVSSRAVMMGFCNAAGALETRLGGISSDVNLRNPRSSTTELAAIESDGAAVTSSGLGVSGCNPNSESSTSASSSDPAYSRLLVNAPFVQSLYSSNFQGVVIAEIAMFRFGDFAFSYDPVFSTVPVIPLTGLSLSLQLTQ